MSREKIAALIIFFLNFIIFSILFLTQKYIPFLVILHIISVLAVWIWLLNPKEALNFLKEKKADFYSAIILFVLSLTILIYKIDTVRPGMYGDETFAGIYGKVLVQSKEMPPFVDSYPHPLAHTYLSGWSVALFGNNIFAIRFPTIVAGALSAVALYVLLRLFFKKKIALITSLIFVFSYQHFVIWRQSYETGESVLFQILALIFLYLLFKKKDLRSLICFGLAIGVGLHFYISIRTIALSMIIVSFFSFRTFALKNKLQYFMILIGSIFVSTAVLLSYAVANWNHFWQRVPALSVFGRNLPTKDVVNEIIGSIKNDMGLFIFSGDPNPRYNPSGVPLYDPISSVLIILGFVFLFLKQRKLFFVFIFLSLPVIANDIFAIEVFPEFHEYGTGHPNSLRISGFIPLFYLLMGFAFMNLESLLRRISKEFLNIALIFTCFTIIIVNLYIYFGQKNINPTFFTYNYRYGNAYVLDVYNFLNKKAINEAYISQSFINDLSNFFLDKPSILKPIDEKNIQKSLDLLASSKILIINTFDNPDFNIKLMEKVLEMSIPYVRLDTPFGRFGAIIINSN